MNAKTGRQQKARIAGLFARYRGIEARRVNLRAATPADFEGRWVLVRAALAAWGDWQAAIDGK